jgi:hypothetical protein
MAALIKTAHSLQLIAKVLLARKAGLRMTVVVEMPCGACGRAGG